MSDNLPMEFGNYVLLDLIARGGMAEIYRAKMRTGIDGLERPVAIKKILPNLAENEEFITMLIDEARISVSLNHANIAQVYDLGRVGESYYIAMEYIPGVDLSYIIKKLGKDGFLLPLDHAIYITKELCAGLYYAHRKTDDNGNLLGIVHRDISPHNVLVGFGGNVKVIDFGVAKASVKLGQTRMGVIKGKLLYMAPEQAMAKAIDARADLFSAGLCLYRMLTGHLPFEADSEFQIYNNVLTAAIKPPKELNPEIPDDLNAVVMRSLARDLDQRYADCWLMHQDLEQVLQRVSPGYTQHRLSGFLDEYFADMRPKPIQHSETSSSGRRSSSYPSTPSARSNPVAQPSAPNTPPAGRQPQQVTISAHGEEDDGDSFGSAGPTVPISGAALAAAAQQYAQAQNQGGPPPALPSPEELGYKPTTPVLEDHEYDADPTVDMKLDPAVMQTMSGLVGGAGKTPVKVPGKAPKTPKSPGKAPKAAETGKGSSKLPLIIAAVVIVLLLLVAAVAALFLTGIIGGDEEQPKPAVEAPSNEPAKPAEPEEEPEPPADPDAAFTEATAKGTEALMAASNKYSAEVVIKLNSEPEGATVYQGRKKLGETPADIEVPRSDKPITFTFKLNGYKSEDAEIVPSTDRTSSVVMQPKNARGTDARKTNSVSSDDGKKDQGKKSDNLLDPW